MLHRVCSGFIFLLSPNHHFNDFGDAIFLFSIFLSVLSIFLFVVDLSYCISQLLDIAYMYSCAVLNSDWPNFSPRNFLSLLYIKQQTVFSLMWPDHTANSAPPPLQSLTLSTYANSRNRISGHPAGITLGYFHFPEQDWALHVFLGYSNRASSPPQIHSVPSIISSLYLSVPKYYIFRALKLFAILEDTVYKTTIKKKKKKKKKKNGRKQVHCFHLWDYIFTGYQNIVTWEIFGSIVLVHTENGVRIYNRSATKSGVLILT